MVKWLFWAKLGILETIWITSRQYDQKAPVEGRTENSKSTALPRSALLKEIG